MQVEASKRPDVFLLDVDCWKHAAHLIVKSGLNSCDEFLKDQGRPWRYFATMAKTANLWRANVKAVFTAFTKDAEYGAQGAMAHAKRVPGRVIAGRWGSIEEFEQLLVNIGNGLSRVFTTAFRKKNAVGGEGGGGDQDNPGGHGDGGAGSSRKRRRRGSQQQQERQERQGGDGDAGATAADPDEVRLQEIQAYRERLGRWAREVSEALNDELFWQVLMIENKVRSPIAHHFRYHNKLLQPSEVLQGGTVATRLICYKIEEIAAEFDTLLTDASWEDAFDDLPLPMACALKEFANKQILHYASAYHRRIVAPTRKSGA